MKTSEQLDLALPAEILELGRGIAAIHAGIRVSYRQNAQQPTVEQVEAIVERVLVSVKGNPVARKLIGFQERQDKSERRVRMRLFALLAHRSLGQPASQYMSDISDVAYASMDPRLPPGEAILRARNVIGKMIIEKLLVGCVGEGFCTRTALVARSMAWLNGGRGSLGFLTADKLCRSLIPSGLEDAMASQKRCPSAMELFEKVKQEVVGLDPQVKVLASRIALHVARAETLRAGMTGDAVGNQVILLVGSSGSGKTFLAETMARKCNLPFVNVDSTGLTSEGYVGASVDDIYRFLTSAAGGDAQEASRGIILLDEFDKKSARYGKEICTQAVQMELLSKLQCNTHFVVGGRKSSSDSRPFTFDGRPTAYCLAGVFSGLDEIIRKKAGKSGIGFASGGGSRRHVYIQDALRDFGYLDELVNRISCVVTLPDPTITSLERATATVIQDGFNQVLLNKGIVLHLGDAAVRQIARYGLETKTFYRGCKQIFVGRQGQPWN